MKRGLKRAVFSLVFLCSQVICSHLLINTYIVNSEKKEVLLHNSWTVLITKGSPFFRIGKDFCILGCQPQCYKNIKDYKKNKYGVLVIENTYSSAFSFPSSPFLNGCKDSFQITLGAEA